MPYESEIIIVGGGLTGLCCAHFFKEKAPKYIDVTVIERDPTYSTAGTTRAIGRVSTQHSTPENVLMALYGAEFIRNMRDWLHVPDMESPDVQFQPVGHLVLASHKGASQLRMPLHSAFCLLPHHIPSFPISYPSLGALAFSITVIFLSMALTERG